MAWEVVVGIEAHTQLLTVSKLFSGASTKFGAVPNVHASAIDVALPGTLPVLNKHAVELAVRFGLAINGEINPRSVFARKNYFYPDLPKGYQISQYELPIVKGGFLKIVLPEGEKTIRLTRAHLEEDAGKSLHENFRNMTGIDLNRAGTPLLEIVSEPDLRGAKEAVAYARTLHSLVREIGICDGNMQEGSFRCDANVSVRKVGDTKLGTRCEIKNLNSFRFMEQAIEFEATRQIEILEDGGSVAQETRLYDPDKSETRSMRSKEDAQDYRYFPDPDLLPLVISEAEIERIRKSLPESLEKKRARYIEGGVPVHIAETLTTTQTDRARVLDAAVRVLEEYNLTREKKAIVLAHTSTAVVSASSAHLDEWGENPAIDKDLPRNLLLIQLRVSEGKISSRQAKEVQEAVLAGEGSTDEIIGKRGLGQMADDSEIERIVDQVLAQNAKQVEDYRAGKEKAFNSLVGQVMKATQGKANPAQVNEILKAKLAR